MNEGSQGSPNASWLVDGWMAWSNGSGIPKGRRFPNLITFHYCGLCPTLREEISATDSNYATTDDDNVAIS